MTSNRKWKKYYLICYDVRNTKRRTKLMKCLKNYGVAVQKSVFEACLYDDDKLRMTEEAKAFIAENDSLRIYVLSKKAYKEKEVTGIPFDYRPEEDVIL